MYVELICLICPGMNFNYLFVSLISGICIQLVHFILKTFGFRVVKKHSHLSLFPFAVRRRREEPGCSRSDDTVLRPAGRQPGVRGHLAPARLSQRWEQPDVCGHAQHESPQP